MHPETSNAVRSLPVRLGLAALLVLLFRSPATAGVNHWTSQGPDGGGGILAVDPRDANHLFVGNRAFGLPVFESRDGGQTWAPRSEGFSGKDSSLASQALQLIIVPAQPDVLYAGMNGGSLFKTVDGGQSWAQIESPPTPHPLTTLSALAVDPAHGDTLYAAAESGVWRSDDGGETWAAASDGIPEGANIQTLTANGVARGTVYAGGTGLFKSVNSGASWAPANKGLESRSVSNIALDPRTGSLLFAATDSGVFRSNDGAATWHPTGLSVPTNVIAVDPRNSLVVYAGTYEGVYKSFDGGSTWRRLSVGGGAQYVYSLAVGSNSLTVYAYPVRGLVRSGDGGQSWTDVSVGLPRPSLVALSAGAGPDGVDFFAGSGRVFRTKDGGKTWQDPGNAGLSTSISALARDPVSSETIYAGGEGVFRTTDGAASWFPRGLDDQLIFRLAVDPHRSGTLYAATYRSDPYAGTGIQKSADGGATWHPASSGLPASAYVWALAFDTNSDDVLFAAVTETAAESPRGSSGVYRSSDGGASWSLSLSESATALALAAGDPPTLYAAGSAGIWRSRDGGTTWSNFRNGVTGPVTYLAVDPAHAGTLYAVIDNSVYRSTNDGESWQPFNSGLDSFTVNDILVSPSGESLHAAAQGVFDYAIRGRAVTLPAAASLHGIAPAHFHSDVSVFNASSSKEAHVVATYRCLAASCPSTAKEFAIPARHVASFPDIVGTLFGQPESGGAIEFDSEQPLVVTSRLYSPSSPLPTYGMFVPGLAPDQAYPRAVLTSLSHSADPATGFRTNVGVYNGNDEAQLVQFSFVDPKGTALGEVSRQVPARQGIQINNVDLPFSAAGDLPSFACYVEGDGQAPLFAYAAVIDNQSQDSIFVPGRDAAAPFGDSLVLPVAASLHGAENTFFHSDVAVLNPSPQSADVSAIFHCAMGVCHDAEKTFHLAAGEGIAFDDMVATLFEAPETGGAIELRTGGAARLVATSRLFTPSRPAPTVGMFAPVFDRFGSTLSAVLTSLSRSANVEHGSRVNVGVYNAFPDSQTVTFRLFASDGTLLGQISRVLGDHASVQINDIFGAIGIAGDVQDAYCLVAGDQSGPIYSYAVVIDNQSQDPIFIPGQNDPNPPPLP